MCQVRTHVEHQCTITFVNHKQNTNPRNIKTQGTILEVRFEAPWNCGEGKNISWEYTCKKMHQKRQRWNSDRVSSKAASANFDDLATFGLNVTLLPVWKTNLSKPRLIKWWKLLGFGVIYLDNSFPSPPPAAWLLQTIIFNVNSNGQCIIQNYALNVRIWEMWENVRNHI